MRATVQMRIADEAAFKATGSWGAPLHDEQLNEQERLLRARVNVLTARVLDEELRGLVGQMHDASWASVIARRKEDADAAHDLVADAFQRVNARLGEILRALY